MNVVCIIPSRWGSTRFPGKPLADINGKSMVRRVYEAAESSGIFSRVLVATDDHRILDHVREFGECVMTHSEFESGTERCFHSLSLLDESTDVLVNLQGDEPFIDPLEIKKFVNNFYRSDYKIGTLMRRESNPQKLISRNTVKILEKEDGGNYFTRDLDLNSIYSGIPIFVHIGIYAFKTDIIGHLGILKKTDMEIKENLEQLRWIDNGYEIETFLTDMESHGIDIPEDIKNFLGNR